MSARIEPHLIPKVSDRGFTYMPPLFGTYAERVSVSESSNASTPCLWLRIVGSQRDQWAAELPVEVALRLADQILYLARNHQQSSATQIVFGRGGPSTPDTATEGQPS